MNVLFEAGLGEAAFAGARSVELLLRKTASRCVRLVKLPAAELTAELALAASSEGGTLLPNRGRRRGGTCRREIESSFDASARRSKPSVSAHSGRSRRARCNAAQASPSLPPC